MRDAVRHCGMSSVSVRHCQFELQERFFAVLPHAQLHNLYGPTEAAVLVTYWKCEPGFW